MVCHLSGQLGVRILGGLHGMCQASREHFVVYMVCIRPVRTLSGLHGMSCVRPAGN